MRRKKSIFMLIIAMVCLVSGCGGKTSQISIGTTGRDDQAYWNIFNHMITASENGYYYIKSEDTYNYIYYMEKRSGKTTALCGKADCRHNDQDCNSYLSREYNGVQIYCYDEKVYVIYNNDLDGLSYLEEIEKDGSGRIRLFEIGEIQNAYCLAFHDGCVYIYVRQGGVSGYETNVATIRERSLDGSKDEIIYSYEDTGAVVYALKSYGDKLFFVEEQQGRVSEEKYAERTFVRKGLYAYDYNTGTVSQFINAAVNDYTIDIENNTIYYYVVDDGLYKKDLNGGSAKKLYTAETGQTNICQLSFDGSYLYMNNEQYFTFFMEPPRQSQTYVFDRDGNIVNEIKSSSAYSTFFGDDQYMFSLSDMAGGYMRYIKKSEITTAKEWIPISN